MRVLQCVSCGAPLNVAQGQRYVPCEFCGATIDVGSRTVVPGGATYAGGPATAPGPYGPGAWPPYPPRPLGSGPKALIVLLAALGAFVALGVTGAVFFFASAGPAVVAVPVPAGGVPTPGPGGRVPIAAPAKANYFADASVVPGQIKAKFGPRLSLKSLVVYDEYVIFTAQNPAKPDDLDTYTLRNGAVDGGRPEQFAGARRKLEAELFSIDDVPFGSLSALGQNALGRLQAAGVTEGKLTHIIVERENFGRGPGVILRPYVSSQRKGGGYVEYDVRGNVKRTVGPSLRVWAAPPGGGAGGRQGGADAKGGVGDPVGLR